MSGDKNVSVIGLGRLGLPLAAVLASRGLQVIGVDRDEERISSLRSGLYQAAEPGLFELLQAHDISFSATTSVQQAVLSTDVTFVIVDTPQTNSEIISSVSVCRVMNEIGRTLVTKNSRHLVVLVSTSYPGSAHGRVIPSLESAGFRCGIDFDFCYSPEFVALGDAVDGYRDPDFTLIGEFDARAGDRLQAIYQSVHAEHTSHVRMDVISAEIAKLSLNFCLVAKISCANFLAQICEKTPGAKIDQITDLISMDRRIGRGFLKGGMPYGGKCFPRDVEAMRCLAEKSGVDSVLPAAMGSINKQRLDDLLQLVEQRAESVPNGIPSIGILGLAFKVNTDETAGSPGMSLIEELSSGKSFLLVHDPAVTMHRDAPVQQFAVAAECVLASDVVVVTTPWKEYASLPPVLFQGKHVVDGWRILTEAQQSACRTYTALGVSAC